MTTTWDRQTAVQIREVMRKRDALDYVQRSCDALGSCIVSDVLALYCPRYANAPIGAQQTFREWFDEWFTLRGYVVTNCGELTR